MRWDRDNYDSSGVEDRRSEGPTGGGGGGIPVFGLLRLFSLFGWKGILVGLVLAGVLAVSGVFSGGGGGGTRPGHHYTPTAEQNELERFVVFVYHDVQNSWAKQINGYSNAGIVLFTGSTRSGCGTATEAVGPFYCPNDRKVYIDLAFYDELRKRFGAPGDFAQAYVIAHEIGHHVQNLDGVLGKHGNAASVQIELQADCLAGAWAKDAEARNELEVGDIDEALNAASQIGDDTLQKREQGYVQPETFTHGSSAQRVASFKRGYQGGAPACGLR